ncbi:MAG TPA: hypothetical protein VHW06_04990 [Streptosporangiaceae bacterium]|nr:hypothetical protein [Streptosporangiaceae bacterium]
MPEEPAPNRRRPRRRGTRGQGGRSRRVLFWAIPAVVVIVIAVVVVVLAVPGSKPAPVTPGSLITTFLPGEIQKVPAACPSVPSATLSTYLPGQTKQAAPPALDGVLDSQCDWTLDQRPTYRLLQLDIRAYTPSGLATGTGSATFAAIDAYASAMQEKQDPAPNTGAPKGQVTVIKGLGTAAFTATQVYQVGGAITDVATTVIRYRNVLVTVILNGLDKSNNGHYGPVSMTELSAGSQAVARAAFAKVGH